MFSVIINYLQTSLIQSIIISYNSLGSISLRKTYYIYKKNFITLFFVTNTTRNSIIFPALLFELHHYIGDVIFLIKKKIDKNYRHIVIPTLITLNRAMKMASELIPFELQNRQRDDKEDRDPR